MSTMDDEKRLRELIRHAEPNKGHMFGHWFGREFYLLFTKTRVRLFHSRTGSSKPRESRLIADEKRDSAGYARIAEAIGL